MKRQNLFRNLFLLSIILACCAITSFGQQNQIGPTTPADLVAAGITEQPKGMATEVQTFKFIGDGREVTVTFAPQVVHEGAPVKLVTVNGGDEFAELCPLGDCKKDGVGISRSITITSDSRTVTYIQRVVTPGITFKDKKATAKLATAYVERDIKMVYGSGQGHLWTGYDMSAVKKRHRDEVRNGFRNAMSQYSVDLFDDQGQIATFLIRVNSDTMNVAAIRTPELITLALNK